VRERVAMKTLSILDRFGAMHRGIAAGAMAVMGDARASVFSSPPADGELWLVILALVAAGIVLALRRRHLGRELAAAVSRFALLESRYRCPVPARRGALAAMEAEVEGYRRAVAALRERRQRELVGRVQAERGLQELEQRYGNAIRGVDDALWEWNLKSDRAWFSTRWKSMLGFADHELSDRIDEWTERIHPDEAEAFMETLKRHLEGDSVRFESEHRLRHHDGGWRWVAVRAGMVRDAASTPSRLVGLMSDITARKRVEECARGGCAQYIGAKLRRGARRARGVRLRVQRLSDDARAHAGALEGRGVGPLRRVRSHRHRVRRRDLRGPHRIRRQGRRRGVAAGRPVRAAQLSWPAVPGFERSRDRPHRVRR
jgi:PAS domain S-box-containing protein